MKEDESSKDKFPELNREEAMARREQPIEENERERAREEAVAEMKQRIEEYARTRKEGRPLPQAQSSRISDVSDFRKGLLWTAVPIVVLSLVSLAGAALEGFSFVWFGAAGLWVIAIIVAFFLYLGGDRKVAAGILAGVGIGILALGASCFANLGTMRW